MAYDNGYGAMTQCFGHWITNAGISSSKPLSGCNVGSALYLSWPVKWVIKTPGDIVVKSKLSACNCCLET